MPENMAEVIKLAQQRCALSGKRLTKNREKVLLVLLSAHVPLSAYQIVSEYKCHFKDRLSAMSVYRALQFLVELRLVHRLETTNQYMACSCETVDYEDKTSQFLICNKCQAVQELDVSQQVVCELKTGAESRGFHLVGPQLELHGLCGNCR